MLKYNRQEPKNEHVSINWRIFVLLSILVLIIYCNTFNAPFHLDDFHNIVDNTRLHVDNLYPGTILEAILENPEKKKLFYRPISNLSIAINWYFGQTNVTGYHIVNIGFHILTAFFLYLSIINLFNTPNLAGRYRGDGYFIAVLAACLWAVNPIQTQAVTYIVQRMAAMAAMFYVMGIYFYIKFRLCESFKRRIYFFSGILFSFLLAVGSKENAIMLPVSLLLLEVVFFRDMSDYETRQKVLLWGAGLIVVVFVFGVFLFLGGGVIESILGSYKNRTFSFFERVLTQPRIVMFYLSQIFYPIADRLSLDHDIVVSTGLFYPWTTLPAAGLILLIVGIAIRQIIKWPLFSFAVLFFFLNHIIESSVIALELVFEHRNYLPSLFLFLPVATGIKRMINHYSMQKKIMEGLVIVFVTLLIALLGLGTYTRNMVWTDEKILWEDVIQKSPGRARGYQNLAAAYYMDVKEYDQAIALFQKAMYLDGSTRNKAVLISLANMANIYAKYKKNYQKAIKLYYQILDINPNNDAMRYHLALTLLRSDRIDDVQEHVDYLLSKEPEVPAYLNIKAAVLLKQDDPEKALTYLIKAIKIAPDTERTLLYTGIGKMMRHNYTSADHYFNRLYQRFPQKPVNLFFLIENSVRAGNSEKAASYAENLISTFSVPEILNALREDADIDLQWPIRTDLIAPVISQKISELSLMSQEISGNG
ncbi:tetratricopeptide repeat protein [Desulfotignum phosphitoxidans]|uniref:Tfp pilus assembly protein, PilE n=1 Tax=Desulfotignum phosphitoxidans DSM 13687 TaxID=1286635 RepID=S0G7F5_9BACT|nr:tetratricopeptide repeat protein [Desulfotignum phosphitoxidans]EMS80851.1 Tfp pilus assembly protein, PilE [Desulfotignum phosphitoxidans DSM 13687]